MNLSLVLRLQTSFVSFFADSFWGGIINATDYASSISQHIKGSNKYYDYIGRPLYIETGYTVAIISRVYIGAGYSAVEEQFIIFDENLNEVYNNTSIISYFIG